MHVLADTFITAVAAYLYIIMIINGVLCFPVILITLVQKGGCVVRGRKQSVHTRIEGL